MVNVDVVTLSGTDHPVCAFIRRLPSIFLMAQPPLLSEEGNTLPCNSFTPSQQEGTEVMLASTFASLNRLESRGLVSSRVAGPETEPEGRTRRYFTVTLAGDRALAQAKETSKLLADFLGDLA